MDIPEELRLRIESKLTRTNSCWLWTACVTGDNHYGQIKYKGKCYSIHVAMYKIYKGEIPKGLSVLHTCDTPRCGNPEHLFLGTHLDNMRDRRERGRTALGMKNGASKLSDADVINIRKTYAMVSNVSALSRQYNVCRKTIRSLLQGKTWKHVTVTE